MNRLKYIFLLITVLTACDYVEEPFIDLKDTGEIVENPMKAVIIEFTGHTCKSCPKAHRTIHMIKQVYGDDVVPVAIHLGYFAEPRMDGKYETDFRTEEGALLEDYFNFVSFPTGLVNRLGRNDLIPYPSWASETAERTKRQAEVIIQADADFDPLTREAEADIRLINNGFSGTSMHLAVYVTENHVVSYQRDEEAFPMDVPDYEHNYVFRDAIGSIWGEEINLDGFSANGLNFVRNIDIHPEWVAENCSLIIFVWDPVTHDILQAERVLLF